MSRMNWGNTGERFFETGVDRGVLYPANEDGVPWNGLTSVEESPSGGEARPYYQDGEKFLNIAAREEFEATIEAFSSPAEFGPCDGTASIQKGLFVTQQPRRAFGLSYRTKVGNDLDGPDHAYKIHLVYNALAAPSSRANGTLTNSPEATTLSWSITTLPPSFTGYKPTAHLIVDSRTTPKALLAAVEDILYGSDIADGRLPMPSELLSMFQSEGPLTRTNLIKNPSYRVTSGTVTVRTNLSTNPSFETNLTGWGNGGGRLTQTVITDTAPPSGGTKVLRNVANVDMGPASGYLTHNIFSLTVGTTYSMSLYVKSDATAFYHITAQWKDPSNVQVGSNVSGTSVSCVAGQWTRIAFTGVCPATADRVQILVLHDTSMVTGDGFNIDACLVEANADIPLTYFDGNTPAAEGLTYSWSGTANNSLSNAVGVDSATAPTKVYTPTSGAVGWVSEPGVYRVLLKRAVPSTALISFSGTGSSLVTAAPGEYFSGRYKVRRLDDGVSANIYSIIYNYTAATAVIQPPIANSPTNVLLTSDWQDVLVPSTSVAQATAATSRWYLRNGTGGFPAGTTLEFKDFLMVKVSDVGIDAGPYFDGSTPDEDNYFYAWSGAVDASESTEHTWN